MAFILLAIAKIIIIFYKQREFRAKDILDSHSYKCFAGFDAFSKLNRTKSQLFLKPVIIEGYHVRKNEKVSNRAIINELFENIYAVRCNLFHGSKTMVGIRDHGLVSDCCIVLEDFLERYIKGLDEGDFE